MRAQCSAGENSFSSETEQWISTQILKKERRRLSLQYPMEFTSA